MYGYDVRRFWEIKWPKREGRIKWVFSCNLYLGTSIAESSFIVRAPSLDQWGTATEMARVFDFDVWTSIITGPHHTKYSLSTVRCQFRWSNSRDRASLMSPVSNKSYHWRLTFASWNEALCDFGQCLCWYRLCWLLSTGCLMVNAKTDSSIAPSLSYSK